MKKLNILLIIITVFSLSCSDTLMDTAIDYKIDSIEDLARLRDSDFIDIVDFHLKNPVFYLTKDLDASDTANWNNGEGWLPLWIPTNMTLDGRGHTISNLTIKSTTTTFPPGFISTNQGTVIDLHLVDITIDASGDAANDEYGAFANSNTGTIARCSVTGLKGGETLGQSTSLNGAGFVYQNNGGSIHNCFSRGSISGAESWGFVAENSSTNGVTNSYSAVTLTGSTAAYGFDDNDTGGVTRCYYDSTLAGTVGTSKATGRTTTEMKDETFWQDTTASGSGWGFISIWDIDALVNDGYPFLR